MQTRKPNKTLFHSTFSEFYKIPIFKATFDNTSMNPSFFGKNILLIFSGSIWATDKSNTNFRILVSSAFGWANKNFTPTKSTADLSIWF